MLIVLHLGMGGLTVQMALSFDLMRAPRSPLFQVPQTRPLRRSLTQWNRNRSENNRQY